MTASGWVQALLFVALTVPLLAFTVMAGTLLVARALPERRIHQMLAWTLGTGLLASLGMVVALLTSALTGGPVAVGLDLGALVSVRGYTLPLRFVVDGPALVLLVLDFVLCGLIGVMSSRYLHREPGYARFFLLLLLFAAGIGVIATAAGLDLLFVGWELVGLSSALLIAFFHRRAAPLEGGLRAFAIYRLTDVGLLTALVTLHHAAGTADFGALFGPSGAAEALSGGAAALVGGLLIFGAMGKGAVVPFTGWLPRAMEGPTPSSAVFYGALSIHASPFLLLRIEPLLDRHLGLRAAVVALGALTALHAASVGRAQSDVKSTLAYASVAQVGLIWVEVGCGLSTLALVHLVGHAVLRTWQLIRSPSALADRLQVMALMGTTITSAGRRPAPLAESAGRWQRIRGGLRAGLDRLALERWYLDEGLEALVRTSRRGLRVLDRLDRRWARVLSRGTAPGAAAGSAPGAAPRAAPMPAGGEAPAVPSQQITAPEEAPR